MDETRIHSPDPVREGAAERTTVVELFGEIDLLTAPAAAEHLDALTAGPRPDVVVDLSSVTFMDCSGLSVLCRARNRALERGGRIRLVVGSPRILRLLRVARLSAVFDVLEALPERLAPAVPG
ncbi:STAS domain-containing protein [Streptomyces sp. GC420]|uniref:STAS domain-containing protein n=1 Tax=Streptomyces sp. GC420 TaxID=2697568 RepID=UPI001414D42C|nr:STAS domain-containing protein [Streptomyces sp. GC420]NBM19810.1 anti-sigma factor antagonist [Streptomyces sp. GC420]